MRSPLRVLRRALGVLAALPLVGGAAAAGTTQPPIDARSTLEAPVRFAFDRSDLDADARSVLQAKLTLLQSDAAIRLRIAGHTDARGAHAYNRALGVRRAAAVRRWLTQRGVAARRIVLATFDAQGPACAADDEPCWMESRRVVFVVVPGTVAISRGVRR